MHVQLPDGSMREVPEGATVADVAAAIGKAPGESRPRRQGERQGRRRLRARLRRREGRDRHAEEPRRARHDPPLHRAPHGHRRAGALPRHAGHHRPGDRERLLLRLRHRPAVHRRGPAPHRREDARRSSKRDLPVRREEWTRDEAIATFEKLGEKFKVEIIKAIPGDETLSLYRHGDWVDLCLGPHGPSTGRLGAFKLLSVAGAYWRGDRAQPDAAAHLRHRVLRQEGARRVPEAHRGGEEARPPQARQGARPLPLPSVRARRGVLDCRRAPRSTTTLSTSMRKLALDERLRRDQDAAALQQGALGDQRPLGQVPGEHVPRARQRDRASTTSRSSR